MPAITAAAITRAIINATDKPASPRRYQITPCFTCGFTYDWNHTKICFCSDRCREFYDKTGRRFEPYRAIDTLRRSPVSAKILGQGAKGAFIECRCCGKKFESQGLVYCSKECVAEAKARKPALTSIMPGKRRGARHSTAAAKQAEYRRRKRNESAPMAPSSPDAKTLRITAKKSH